MKGDPTCTLCGGTGQVTDPRYTISGRECTSGVVTIIVPLEEWEALQYSLSALRAELAEARAEKQAFLGRCINVPLTNREQQAIDELSQTQELSPERIMLQALRLYQLVVTGNAKVVYPPLAPPTPTTDTATEEEPEPQDWDVLVVQAKWRKTQAEREAELLRNGWTREQKLDGVQLYYHPSLGPGSPYLKTLEQAWQMHAETKP